MNVVFFASPAELRGWFEAHHDTARELWVGYYKKGSGRAGLTWAESVDEALCYGWIDGIRKSIDDVSYTNRFTPRRAESNWSAVNIKRVAELTKQGRMRPPGLAAFEAREDKRSGRYSYEQRKEATLDAGLEAAFRANEPAWAFFQSQPPSYRQSAIWWVVSAKREETRRRRLQRLIEDSANRRRLAQLSPGPRGG